MIKLTSKAVFISKHSTVIRHKQALVFQNGGKAYNSLKISALFFQGNVPNVLQCPQCATLFWGVKLYHITCYITYMDKCKINHICSITAARSKRRCQSLKISLSTDYTRFLWSRILLFSISVILTGYSPSPFPIDDKSVKHIKIHSNGMKTEPGHSIYSKC